MALTPPSAPLPPYLHWWERGWLSANNVLCIGAHGATLVDSGYCSHAAQTVALVRHTLGQAPLTTLLNTHLHSDHCGGNAALQAAFPQLHTRIPAGPWIHVQTWDAHALSYLPTGQDCPRFHADSTLAPGDCVVLGDTPWQVHAAPGHDPHAVLLWEPQARLLISGDALWADGFGVVFPEIEGVHAFEEVAQTLDLIESLQPAVVLPGHGPLFTDVATALATARRRLDGFVHAPRKHATYAAKVLLKFKLMQWQQQPLAQVLQWIAQTPYLQTLHRQHFAEQDSPQWSQALVQSLVNSGAARLHEGQLYNAG